MRTIFLVATLVASVSFVGNFSATAQQIQKTPPAPVALPPGSQIPVGNAVISYIEVAPDKASRALAILKKLKAASTQDDGFVSLVVLQRLTHANHFMILEEWRDNAAREAHAAQSHVVAARAALKAIESAPYDERPHRPLAVGASAEMPKRPLYAVTHVDYVPVFREQGEAALKTLASASRGTRGNIRFDVLTQASRPNHMTIVEIWNSPNAWKRHAATPHIREYRMDLLPKSGSLYDERLYRAAY